MAKHLALRTSFKILKSTLTFTLVFFWLGVVAPAFAQLGPCQSQLYSQKPFLERVQSQTQWIDEISKERALVPYDPINAFSDLQKRVDQIVNPKARGLAPITATDLESVLVDLSKMSKILVDLDSHTPWAQDILRSRADVGLWAEDMYLKLMERMLKSQGVETTRVTLGDGSKALQVVADSKVKAQRIAKHLAEKVGVSVHFASRNISDNALGFFRGSDRIIVLNHNMILAPRSGMRTYLHETRHAQYFSKRLNQQPSIYHGAFYSTDAVPYSDSPIYNTYMSLEELMTHSLDTRIIGGWLDLSLVGGTSYESSKKLSGVLQNLYGKVKNSFHISKQSLNLLEKIRASREIGGLEFSLTFIKNNSKNSALNQVLWANFEVGNVNFRLPYIGSEWSEISKQFWDYQNDWSKPTQQLSKAQLDKLNVSFDERVEELIKMNQELLDSYNTLLSEMRTELFTAEGKYLGTAIELKPETLLRWKKLSQEPRRITLKYDRKYQPSGDYRIDN